MKPILIPAIASFALLTGCGGGEKPARPAASAPAVPVTIVSATLREWPEVYEATGTVHARTTASVSSRVMAYVQQVSVQVGDHVREGQVVATLDAREFEANVRRAEAARAEVRSAIPEADNGVAGAKANLDLAQSTLSRMQELAAKKSISNQELDEATTRVKAAQAGYEMARSKRSQLDSKAAQVEEEIRAARIMRDYTRITAPFEGVVTARSVEPGNLASPGAPLATIEREGGYRLEAAVDESRVATVKPGQAVEITLEALGKKMSARVSEIVPAVDASARAYTVKIDVPAVAGLRSGMFGRALFPLGSRKVLTVPATALIERGQLTQVFVIEDGTARTRLVTTGRHEDDAVELLSGLSEGERVIAPAPANLADGARVEVRR